MLLNVCKTFSEQTFTKDCQQMFYVYSEADTGFSERRGGGLSSLWIFHTAVSGQNTGRQNTIGQNAGQTFKGGQNAGHFCGQKYILLMVK